MYCCGGYLQHSQGSSRIGPALALLFAIQVAVDGVCSVWILKRLGGGNTTRRAFVPLSATASIAMNAPQTRVHGKADCMICGTHFRSSHRLRHPRPALRPASHVCRHACGDDGRELRTQLRQHLHARACRHFMIFSDLASFGSTCCRMVLPCCTVRSQSKTDIQALMPYLSSHKATETDCWTGRNRRQSGHTPAKRHCQRDAARAE